MEWFRVNISRNVIVFIEIVKEGRYMNLKRICIEEILKHKFYPMFNVYKTIISKHYIIQNMDKL